MFAKRTRELRMSRGITVRRLADDLGIWASSLSQYENLKRVPDIDTCKLIADYFNVTCDYLMGLDDDANGRWHAGKQSSETLP